MCESFRWAPITTFLTNTQKPEFSFFDIIMCNTIICCMVSFSQWHCYKAHKKANILLLGAIPDVYGTIPYHFPHDILTKLCDLNFNWVTVGINWSWHYVVSYCKLGLAEGAHVYQYSLLIHQISHFIKIWKIDWNTSSSPKFFLTCFSENACVKQLFYNLPSTDIFRTRLHD